MDKGRWITALLAMWLACLPGEAMVPTDSTRSGKPVHSFGVDIRPGYVFPTNRFLEGDNAAGKPVNAMLSAHLKYAFRFAPDSRLGRLYPSAYQGMGLSYTDFFNAREVGRPVSLYAFQGARIARLSPSLSLNYEWNFGAAFGWEKRSESNPYNNVTGSHINAYINLGFYLDWQLARQWALSAGIDFSHYSNGNTNYPNSGINTAGARIGLVYTPQPAEPVPPPASLHAGRRFSYDLVAYASTRKRGYMWPDHGELIPGCFAVLGLNFNPMYIVNKYFRAGLSLDAQYDESANLHSYLADGAGDDLKFYRPPFREQFAVGLSARAELNMPVFSVNVGIGRNVFCKGEDTDVFYQILALKAFVTRHLFLHVGYQLNNFRYPNNLMLGLGYRF